MLCDRTVAEALQLREDKPHPMPAFQTSPYLGEC